MLPTTTMFALSRAILGARRMGCEERVAAVSKTASTPRPLLQSRIDWGASLPNSRSARAAGVAGLVHCPRTDIYFDSLTTSGERHPYGKLAEQTQADYANARTCTNLGEAEGVDDDGGDRRERGFIECDMVRQRHRQRTRHDLEISMARPTCGDPLARGYPGNSSSDLDDRTGRGIPQRHIRLGGVPVPCVPSSQRLLFEPSAPFGGLDPDELGPSPQGPSSPDSRLPARSRTKEGCRQ